jgi:LmbE family N-acetylglucosaminyl deacetylase
MNISYLIYEAERPRTTAQQHEADMRAGEMAAAAKRLGCSLRHPFGGKPDARRGSQRAARSTVPCATRSLS